MCQNLRVMLVYDGVDLSRDDQVHWWWSFSTRLRSAALVLGQPPHSRLLTYDMWENSNVKPSEIILRTVQRLAPDTLEDDLGILMKNIDRWLTACTASGNHEKCTSLEPSTSRKSPLPTRLIDVGTQDGDTLRLVEFQTEYPRDHTKPLYLILSYRWGDGNRSARTTRSNVQQRKKQLPIQELPQTIQDAIKIARRMGICYLWVDAVCIIQPDNDGETEDWLKEAANMANYYSNAYCCIAASSAQDSSEGILVERIVAKFPFREWCNPGGNILKSPHDSRRGFENPLLQRGWCLQEWILSPRILHWTRNGLIWQCNKGFFWEGQRVAHDQFPENAWAKDRLKNDCPFKIGRSSESTTDIWQIIESTKDDALGYQWNHLICCYSQMKLTIPEDRLAAIHGIATYLSNRHKVSYFAGIFEHKNLDALLWSMIGERQTKLEGFPSWSWASTKGELLIPRTTNRTRLMNWIGKFPSGNNIQDFGKRLNRQIHMTAPLIPLTPERILEIHTPTKKNKLFTLDSKKDIWFETELQTSLDYYESDFDDLMGSCLLFLRKGPLHREFRLEGLIVHKSSIDGDNVYQRIGTFMIIQHDLKEGIGCGDTLGLENWRADVILV